MASIKFADAILTIIQIWRVSGRTPYHNSNTHPPPNEPTWGHSEHLPYKEKERAALHILWLAALNCSQEQQKLEERGISLCKAKPCAWALTYFYLQRLKKRHTYSSGFCSHSPNIICVTCLLGKIVIHLGHKSGFIWSPFIVLANIKAHLYPINFLKERFQGVTFTNV